MEINSLPLSLVDTTIILNTTYLDCVYSHWLGRALDARSANSANTHEEIVKVLWFIPPQRI